MQNKGFQRNSHRISVFVVGGIGILMLLAWSVLIADQGGGIGILSSGTGGGPIAGSVHVTVIKAGSDAGGGTPVPVSGAFVMIGLHEGEPFQGNYGFTDGTGEITFSDPALIGPQMVTAGADGYEFYTFADVDASSIAIPLQARDVVVPTSQVTGSLSNFSGVNCDNLLQMSLVIPPISLDSLIGFNIAGQLTENVPVQIFGNTVYLPGNLVIPSQNELPTSPGWCWLLGVNISKPNYILYLPTGTTQDIFSFGLQADVNALLGGSFDISTMTPLKIGISRNVVISGTMTANINMTHTLTSNLTLAVANAPSGSNVLLASLGEINGNLSYAPGVGDLVLLGFGQVAGGTSAAAVLTTAAKTSPFNDMRYLAAAIASFPAASGLTGATGLLDRGNYTPPVTRSLNTFFLPVQLNPVVGNYFSFSNAYHSGISPLPDINFSGVSLVTTVPDTRPGAQPGATMDLTENLWTIASPGEDLAVYLPALPSSAPQLPLFPDQTPAQDRLVWSQTIIALTLNPTFNFNSFGLDVITQAMTHFSGNSLNFSYCQDRDGDGYGNPASPACTHPELDCTDDPSSDLPICATCTCGSANCSRCARCIHPGATEVCDGVDNNCDGQIDENPAASASCQNGNACDGQEYCSSGSCHQGTPLNCDDGNPCTDDTCHPATGCVHTNNTAPCDDGNACTTNDYCSAGVCAGGAALNCDDGNVCTDDTCNPSSGCVHTPNTAPCDDGNQCTTNDHCTGGTCAGTLIPGCSQCTLPNDPACNDGNPCTDDSCVSGQCVHTNNTASCSDGNACTTNDHCSAGVCVGGAALNCDDGNVCTYDTCNSSTGCVHTNNTAPCNDGNACTTNDHCSGGVCVGGAALNCDDGNVCTDDTCNPTTGCVHTNNTASCNDGNACTTNDHCSAGVCVGGPPPNCDDGNPCTTDTCNSSTGCIHTNNAVPCNDGNACTVGDTCSGGVCVGGPPPNCDDGNVCTNDTCDPITGCVHTPVSCDDWNACTNDFCDPATGCYHTANTCDDGNACTNDNCDIITGCYHTPVNCDDGNACTNDSCDPATGCAHACNATGPDDPCCSNSACVGNPICQGCTLPGIPSLSSPSNGATNVSTTPLLSGGHVPNAISYDIQVCSDSECSLVVTSATDLTVTIPQWTVSPPLNKATTYWWRIKADNACGSGPWTSTWSFTTGSCFIATAAFGTAEEGKIDVLRSFRDTYLLKTPTGNAFVTAYYNYSPPVAEYIAERAWLRAIIRALLLPVIGFVSLLI